MAGERWSFVTWRSDTYDYIEDEEGELLAHVLDDSKGPLMAAAPELLKVLRDLVNDFDRSVWTTDPMLVEAREAIAKAEGAKS